MSVVWSIIAGGHGTTWAGVASFAIQLPVAAGLAIGGTLADRLGSRTVLLGSNLASLGAITAVGALSVLGTPSLPTIVVLLALSGFLGAPGSIAQDARVPDLALMAGLPLERANGLRDIASNVAMATGPAMGVLLVEMGGLMASLGVATAILAVVAIIDTAVFPAFAIAPRETGGTSGFRILAQDRTLVAIAAIGVGMVAAFTSLDEIVAPSLATASGVGGGALAGFLAVSGASALAGGLLYAAVGHRLPPHPTLVAGIATTAAGFVLLAALPTGVAFVLAPALIGLGVGPLQPLVTTALQRRVPAAVRATVLGAFAAAILAVQPFAALGAGPAVDLFGAGAVAWAIAGLACAALLAAGFAPALRALGECRDDS